MSYRSSAGLALISVIVASPASAAVDFVVDGSFESGVNPGVFRTLGVGSPDIAAWTISSGTIDYIGSYWQASDGVRSVDLNGNNVGVISQTLIGLTVGASYRVTFDLSGNPDGAPATKFVGVSVDAFSTSFSYPGGNTRTAMIWAPQSFLFTATASSAVLSFAGDTSAPGFFGPALDNVSVTSAVPELSTWAMMLIGFGGLGALSSRRRRIIAG